MNFIKRRLALSFIVIFATAALITGAVTAWFTAEAQVENVFTAGTVSIEAGSSAVSSMYFDPSEAIYLYGVEQGTGDLYEINVQSGTANRIFDTPNVAPDNTNSPNGLAFDRPNHRLYFAAYNSEAVDQSKIYFYDFTTKQLVDAGNINAVVAGATYGRGYFWYIKNATDHLHRVSFNAAGLIVQDEFVASITGGVKTFRFGDIAFDIIGNVLYGSSLQSGTTAPEFFKYDLNTSQYQMVSQSGALRLQLAFGSNGTLYGHDTTSKNWYEINRNTGTVNKMYVGSRPYTDLASGYVSVWNPGDCTEEACFVKNTGTKNARVRVIFSGGWYEFDENVNDWVPWTPVPDLSVVSVSVIGNDWVSNNDGYYYYNGQLSGTYYGVGGEAEIRVKVCLDGPNTDNQYQGKRFILSAKFEAIQASNDASADEWGWSP